MNFLQRVKRRLLAADLQHILARTGDLWELLRKAQILITGGTGFFGTWLLESFLAANEALDLDARAVVLTRSISEFRKRAPHLAGSRFILEHEGDVQNFNFPKGEFRYVIHAATQPDLVSGDAGALFNANLQGTSRVLACAAATGARRLLFTSSGAVYGRQPTDLTHVPEEYLGAPTTLDLTTAYGQSKRASEFLCLAEAARAGFEALIARPFAFVGPHLPLEANYAIGNFVRDAISGGPIRIAGDGTPYRSYLYAADLAIWLWAILFRGKPGEAYNVGSDHDVDIAELARTVASVIDPKVEVVIAQQPDPTGKPLRYVPSIEKARRELGLESWIDLKEGIKRMADWYRAPRES